MCLRRLQEMSSHLQELPSKHLMVSRHVLKTSSTRLQRNNCSSSKTSSRKKVTFNENVGITDHASGIRLLDYSKLAINLKNGDDVTIWRHGINVKYFWRCCVSRVKFSYWSKFHVNIITGSGATVGYLSRICEGPRN